MSRSLSTLTNEGVVVPLLLVRVENNNPPNQPNINAELDAFTGELYQLEDAQRMLLMSRTGFFRFRSVHRIRTIMGRKIHGADVVRALEVCRGRGVEKPLPALRDYSKSLLSRHEVCSRFQLKITSLYKLRVRHKVPMVAGSVFHVDDIIAALDAERRGERRPAGPDPIRVMTRTRNPNRPLNSGKAKSDSAA